MAQYFLKYSDEREFKEVSKEEYMEAEKMAGFNSKIPGEPATSAFGGKGIEGEIRNIFRKCGEPTIITQGREDFK